MTNVVLDTNCLLMSLSRRSLYYPVWRNLIDGNYTLCYSNEILAEYEEILTWKMGRRIAGNIISAILNLPNTRQIQVYFHLQMISADPDDNKFVDCAFKANAQFIVTEDRHYDVLNEVNFPKIDVIGIDDFLKLLQQKQLNQDN